MGANKDDKSLIQLTAKAKINLGLDITGRLANGYHGVRMVMQTLALGDEVTVALESTAGAEDRTADTSSVTVCAASDTYLAAQDLISIVLTCSDSSLPCDEHNLAYRAAALLRDEYLLKDSVSLSRRLYDHCAEAEALARPDNEDRSERVGCRISINIDKKIPVAAGLAGGSADAAAVLVALNELCELGLTQRELMDLGLKLGADVPFCIMQGTALSEGIGEVLTPLPALPPVPVLLVKPDIAVSTKWAYETWDALTDPQHPDIDALAECIHFANKRNIEAATEADCCTDAIKADYCVDASNDGCAQLQETELRELGASLGNTFERLVFEKHPVVREIKEDMIRLGAAGALMSGSGPTVFALFPDDDTLARTADEMRSNYPDVFVCETHIL